MIDTSSHLWQYLSDGQKGLIEETFYLLEDSKNHPDARLTDYSYLVFPMAKAYEGFLKQLFLDRGYISRNQYQSNHFRIGKALSPNLQYQLGKKSIYIQLKNQRGILLADKMWDVWKRGRNLLFHYFPHNLKAISLQDAEGLVYDFIKVMEEAVRENR